MILIKDIKQKNFYIIRRNNFIKNFSIHFNKPILFDYIKNNLSKTHTYYFYQLIITYIDNWNVSLGNEEYLGKLIKRLIRDFNYSAELISKLNKVISNQQFGEYVQDCQQYLLKYVENDHINTNKVLKFINTYEICLKESKETNMYHIK